MKIGIDLGGSHIAIGVVNENGEIIKKIETFIKDRENVINQFEEFVIQNVNKIKNEYTIDSIGIAIPGTVSDKSIIKSVNLGIENYNVVEQLEKRLKIKIKIKNDAKCAALAEKEYGELKAYKNAIFICIGTGIGSAVIYENKLLQANGVPGFEFSHTIIQKDGELCNCGKRGCFETYASLKKFKEKIKSTYNLESIDGEIIREFIKNNSNDEKLKEIINKYVENLGIGISNIINIFEPEAIIFGGSFAEYKDIFYNPLKSALLNENLLFNPRDDIIMKFAKLKNDAGIIGATLI